MTDDKSEKKPFPESQPFEETTFPQSKPFNKTSFDTNDPFYVPIDQVPDEEAISAVFPEETEASIPSELTSSEPTRKKSSEEFLNVPVDQVPDEEAISALFPDEDQKTVPVPTPPRLDPEDIPADEEVYIIPEIVEEPSAEKEDAIIIDPRSPHDRRSSRRRGNPPPIGPPERK